MVGAEGRKILKLALLDCLKQILFQCDRIRFEKMWSAVSVVDWVHLTSPALSKVYSTLVGSLFCYRVETMPALLD